MLKSEVTGTSSTSWAVFTAVAHALHVLSIFVKKGGNDIKS
jgi:hypothetical protein